MRENQLATVSCSSLKRDELSHFWNMVSCQLSVYASYALNDSEHTMKN